MKRIVLIILLLLFAFACSSTPKATEVSLEQFHQALADPGTLVLDVRVGMSLGGDMNFFQNAKQIPLSTIDNNLAKIPKDKNIYVVGGDVEKAQKGATVLLKAGYPSVFVVNGTPDEYVSRFGAEAKPYMK